MILGILCFALLISGHSQCLIGRTVSEVKEEFSDPMYNLQEHIVEDEFPPDAYYITVEYPSLYLLYYFFPSKDDVCGTYLVFPIHDELNKLVQLYNEKFVIIDERTWYCYFGTDIFVITLEYSPKGDGFFKWIDK